MKIYGQIRKAFDSNYVTIVPIRSTIHNKPYFRKAIFAPWEIFHAFCRLLIFFFQNQLFRKFLPGIPSECVTDWIQIRPDVLSGLVWVQSVCKSYQQKTPGGKELIRSRDIFPNLYNILIQILSKNSYVFVGKL